MNKTTRLHLIDFLTSNTSVLANWAIFVLLTAAGISEAHVAAAVAREVIDRRILRVFHLIIFLPIPIQTRGPVSVIRITDQARARVFFVGVSRSIIAAKAGAGLTHSPPDTFGPCATPHFIAPSTPLPPMTPTAHTRALARPLSRVSVAGGTTSIRADGCRHAQTSGAAARL